MQKNLPESQAIIKIKNTLPKKEGETQQFRINKLVKPIPNKHYVIPVYFSADRKPLILDFHNFVNAYRSILRIHVTSPILGERISTITLTNNVNNSYR